MVPAISAATQGYPATVTTRTGTPVTARNRRAMAGLLLAAALLIAAYWLAWLLHRSLVASETGVAYTQFEDAFPLADGWLALCLVAASYCLWTARRAALFWLLAGGGAGLYLFAMDVLYDLQHGVWGKGANGANRAGHQRRHAGSLALRAALDLGSSRRSAFMMGRCTC